MTIEIETDQTKKWHGELKEQLRQIQEQTFMLVLALFWVGGILLLLPAYDLERSYVLMVITLAAFGVSILCYAVYRRNYLIAAWLLVSSSIALSLTIVITVPFTAGIFILAVVSGMALLLISRAAGIGVGAACSLLLVLVPAEMIAIEPGMRFTAVAMIWLIISLLLLVLRPLFSTVEWAWAGYEHNQSLIKQAREYQMQLLQVMDDLTGSNNQLARLNKFAQDMRLVAEEERRIKEQFVANVSHELRTPLNMIIGFCETISTASESYGVELPYPMKADLGVILRNSQHLSALIDDVLDLSQIDAGQMALTQERVSMNQIIEEATIAVRPLFESKNLSLDVTIDSSLPPVFCDRTRIREVILNLLSNAGRFTELGGIDVRASRQENTVVVSVADTGPGISPADRARLFQPFQQLDGTIRQRFGGTGLGLSISKRFIELHDGRMWVESQPGIGSTFFFKIPIDPIPPLEGGVLRWMNPYQTYIERTRSPMVPSEPVRPRVLLVEQGQSANRLLKRHMEGVDLVHVTNLSDAIHQIEEHPIQALLVNALDVSRVLRDLKQDTGLPQGVPTFIFSLPDSARPVNDLQVSNYLVKPIRKDDLLAALDQLGQKIEIILVVDDDTDALRLFRRMLLSAKRNYQVMRAENGKQALEMIAQMRPDVILMDLVMPEMNGFQFLSLREQDPVLSQIPVILTSARDPNGQPIVSDALTVTFRDGLSVQQLINGIQTLVAMVSGKFQEPGAAHPEAPRG